MEGKWQNRQRSWGGGVFVHSNRSDRCSGSIGGLKAELRRTVELRHQAEGSGGIPSNVLYSGHFLIFFLLFMFYPGLK